ncbi:DUF927 domain-containing protein [Aeromonas hydrophila]|uniref:DUF927 domain-containing protein n=1 Tax=Aeromonas hydrophila TaxID=644 RepID=A0A926FND1_AERHY|nr:DUF927 domain-containing protein [Aeromonas hydrophila]
MLMEFRLLPDALECRESERWVKIGGHIKVRVRTRAADQKRSYGVLLEWKNLDGVYLQDIVLVKHLQGDNSRQVREMLIDSGYPLELSPTHGHVSSAIYSVRSNVLNLRPVLNEPGGTEKVLSLQAGVPQK